MKSTKTEKNLSTTHNRVTIVDANFLKSIKTVIKVNELQIECEKDFSRVCNHADLDLAP